MNENKLISTICSSREAYAKLQPVVDQSTFSDFGKLIYKEVVQYYETDSSIDHVDIDLIKVRAIELKPKQEGLIQDYFASLPEPSSADNILRLYADQHKTKLRDELIIALGSGNDRRVADLVDQYMTFKIEEKSGEEIYNSVPVEELEVHFTGKNLLPIYPTALCDALGGGVPRQSQLCIFARPDVGKSTVAINAAVGAAERGFKVLYIGNEDPSAKMLFRILTRFTRMPEQEIRRNPKVAYETARRNGYENIYFVAMHPGNGAELRKWIEKLQPDMVVIDQIRNMNFKPESMTINLEQGVITTRNLAKEFNLVMVVITQAGNSAANKTQLNMEDVEWSNTGVAAQMDLMIGVGQNEQMKESGLVMLSFPKNKLSAPIRPILANIDYSTNRLTVTE